jgi:hypothetical protein
MTKNCRELSHQTSIFVDHGHVEDIFLYHIINCLLLAQSLEIYRGHHAHLRSMLERSIQIQVSNLRLAEVCLLLLLSCA